MTSRFVLRGQGGECWRALLLVRSAREHHASPRLSRRRQERHVPSMCLSSSRELSNATASPSTTEADRASSELERTTYNVPRLKPFKPRRAMINEARTVSVNVAGVTFDQRQELVKMMRVGNAVLLEQEPSNRFDPFAVAVYTLSGEKLGYVPRTMTHLMRQQRYALGIVESVGPVAMDEDDSNEEEGEEGDVPPTTMGGGSGDDSRLLESDREGEEAEDKGPENVWYLCVTVKPSLPALTIDLVPRNLWGTNIKAEVSQEDWDRLRTEAYERAGYRCEVCSDQGDKWPVECQEEYHYDSESPSRNKQTLHGLVALCPSCHKVKHAGRSIISGDLKRVTQQLMRVNRWTYNESLMYLQHAFSTWQERSLVAWEQDFSVLDPLKIEGKHQEWEGDPMDNANSTQ